MRIQDNEGMKDVEVIQVVRTTIPRRGEGIEGDPIRRVTQYWTLDGDLLAEVDPEKTDYLHLMSPSRTGA